MALGDKIALIIGGGAVDLEQVSKVASEYKPCLLIAADSGLEVFERLGMTPDIAAGDFDSLTEKKLLEDFGERSCEIHRFPREKDYTDMRLACELALEHFCDKIVILGATGSRLDHVLANMFLLRYLLERGTEGVILDPNNRIRCVGEGKYILFKKEAYASYISFLPVSGDKTVLSLKGFKYNTDRLVLNGSDIITVSNEIEEDYAELTVIDGVLLVVESRD